MVEPFVYYSIIVYCQPTFIANSCLYVADLMTQVLVLSSQLFERRRLGYDFLMSTSKHVVQRRRGSRLRAAGLVRLLQASLFLLGVQLLTAEFLTDDVAVFRLQDGSSVRDVSPAMDEDIFQRLETTFHRGTVFRPDMGQLQFVQLQLNYNYIVLTVTIIIRPMLMQLGTLCLLLS